MLDISNPIHAALLVVTVAPVVLALLSAAYEIRRA